MSNSRSSSRKILRMVMVALFAAIAYAVMIVIHFPVSFLTLDVKDSVIALCGLYFGPLAALLISVIVPVLELITISSTGIYGLAMNILGSAAFSVTASLIYKYKKTLSGAAIALVSGALAGTAVMLLFNLIITPAYLGISVAEVRELIPALLLPFNLIKSSLNAGIVLLLYKPISSVLQKNGIIPKSEHTFRMDLRTLIVCVVAVVLILASLFVIFNVLDGSFSFGLPEA